MYFHRKQRTGYYFENSSGNIYSSIAARYIGANSSDSTVDDYVGLTEKIARESTGSASGRSSVWDIKYLTNATESMLFNAFSSILLQGLQLGGQNNSKNFSCDACVGDYCFFLLNEMVSSSQARQRCNDRGSILADLQNVEQLQLAESLSSDPAWISTWQGNNYGNSCLVFNIGSITIPTSCDARYNAVCQVQRNQCK